MQYVIFASPDSKLPALLGGNATVTRAVTRESLSLMLAADAVVVDAACGNDAWYVLGLLHGQHRQAVLVDRDVTRDELVSMIANATRPFAPPLAGVIDSAAIDAHVRSHLERHGILGESDATARASRWKRSSEARSLARCEGRTLMATSRCSRSSSAR